MNRKLGRKILTNFTTFWSLAETKNKNVTKSSFPPTNITQDSPLSSFSKITATFHKQSHYKSSKPQGKVEFSAEWHRKCEENHSWYLIFSRCSYKKSTDKKTSIEKSWNFNWLALQKINFQREEKWEKSRDDGNHENKWHGNKENRKLQSLTNGRLILFFFRKTTTKRGSSTSNLKVVSMEVVRITRCSEGYICDRCKFFVILLWIQGLFLLKVLFSLISKTV